MILRQAQTFAFLFSPWRAPPAARHPYRASGLVLAQIAAIRRRLGEWVTGYLHPEGKLPPARGRRGVRGFTWVCAGSAVHHRPVAVGFSESRSTILAAVGARSSAIALPLRLAPRGTIATLLFSQIALARFAVLPVEQSDQPRSIRSPRVGPPVRGSHSIACTLALRALLPRIAPGRCARQPPVPSCRYPCS